MKEYDGNYSDGTYQDVEVGHPQILMRDKIKLQWRNKQNMWGSGLHEVWVQVSKLHVWYCVYCEKCVLEVILVEGIEEDVYRLHLRCWIRTVSW